jgi:hypothetical protein
MPCRCVSPEQITLSNYMRSLENTEPDMGVPSAERPESLAPKHDGSRPADSSNDASDATEVIWEERIKGVRHAYTDSCSRLVGALEELEQTLCTLTGDEYRADQPLLHARAHMAKSLELFR